MSEQDAAELGRDYQRASEIIDKVADRLTPDELAFLRYSTGISEPKYKSRLRDLVNDLPL